MEDDLIKMLNEYDAVRAKEAPTDADHRRIAELETAHMSLYGFPIYAQEKME